VGGGFCRFLPSEGVDGQNLTIAARIVLGLRVGGQKKLQEGAYRTTLGGALCSMKLILNGTLKLVWPTPSLD
jgi:hypothetical protein